MNEQLEEIARRVNWYTPPERVLANRSLFLAQVMARGRAEDVVTIQAHFPAEQLRDAYLNAPPGLFTKRAWAYWGLMLLGDPERPMPKRFDHAPDFNWRRTS